jgi:hypothetical protein
MTAQFDGARREPALARGILGYLRAPYQQFENRPVQPQIHKRTVSLEPLITRAGG